MEEVENTNLDTDQIPDEIIIFPPDDGEVTDEDSGEEDNVVINNLPGAQLRTLAEVVLPNIEDVSDVDSEDDLPLSRLVKRQQVSRPKKKQTELAWIKTDITPKMPSWNNLNYHIFFDNLFTSLPLLLELKSRGLKGTGTIRENRLPKSCPIKSADKLRKEQRGSLDFASSVNNELTVCKWHDNNIVSIFSNNMKVLPTTQIKRFSRKEKKVIYVPQPNIIKKYNENMGGVDRADENISLYRVSIRGKKWYFPLLCHFVDMAEQNAWRIHKVNGGKLDHLGFRRIIATGILESFKKRQLLQGCSKLSKHAHSYSRYDGMDHIMVVYQDKQTRCASCHKKCNFLCQKCDIALHPKQCFLLYHTK
nr:unnamed protein product [Callosobruchus chinensis]